MPLVNKAKIGTEFVERNMGRAAAAEYAANLADLGALLQAVPEIYVDTVIEARPMKYNTDAEARRVISRLRPVHAHFGQRYVEQLDAVQDALSHRKISEAVT